MSQSDAALLMERKRHAINQQGYGSPSADADEDDDFEDDAADRWALLRHFPGFHRLLRILLVVRPERAVRLGGNWKQTVLYLLPFVGNMVLFGVVCEQSYQQVYNSVTFARAAVELVGINAAVSFMAVSVSVFWLNYVFPWLAHAWTVWLLNYTDALPRLMHRAWRHHPDVLERAKDWVWRMARRFAVLIAAWVALAAYVLITSYHLVQDGLITKGVYIAQAFMLLADVVVIADSFLFAFTFRMLRDLQQRFIVRVESGHFTTDDAAFDAHLRLRDILSEASANWERCPLYVLTDPLVVRARGGCTSPPPWAARSPSSFRCWYFYGYQSVALPFQMDSVSIALVSVSMVAYLSLIVYGIVVLNLAGRDVVQAIVRSKLFTGPQRVALAQQIEILPATFTLYGLAISKATVVAVLATIAGATVPLMLRAVVNTK